MEKLKTLFLPFVASALILACNNSTSNSQGEDTDTDMPEKLFKEFTHPDLSELTPLTMEELEAWLPAELGGLPLHSVHPGSMSRSGVNGIAGRYINNGDKEIILTVTDGAGPTAAPIAGGMFGQVEKAINGKLPLNKGEEIVTIGGIRAIQSYNDYSYHHSFVHQGRLLISVDASRLSKDEAEQVIEALPMDKLIK